MTWDPQDRLWTRRLTRRDFLVLAGAGVGSAALCGCAADPVTGRSTLMLVSQGQESAIDRNQSPHQFSRDYGTAQDPALNAYLATVGRDLSRVSHRPAMPYSFRAVNASYANAYAFPGGSIAATRGILLRLEDESELAALLGHEIGHVAARHSAEQQSAGILTQLAVAGATIAVASSEYRDYAGVAEALGGVGAGALLAHYSREAEREGDALGMDYAAKSGANPHGMVGLMEVLSQEGKRRPSALEQMFATHPLNSERYATAKQRATAQYGALAERPRNRERYLDNTAGLRRIGPAIEAMQVADKAMQQGRMGEAEAQLSRALKVAPNDYAALVMMAKVQIGQGDASAARRYAARAVDGYPNEAQGRHVRGIADLALKQYEGAYADFSAYQRLLPGNPNTVFLKGVCLEGMNRKREAAEQYYTYIQSVKQGNKAKYAYQRLVGWGFIRRR